MSRMVSDKLLVVIYHDVDENPSEFSRRYELNVLPRVFEEQIKFYKNHFNIINAHQLISGDWTGPAVFITFDDGMQSFFNMAVPILKKHGVPSTIFLNMGPIKGEIFYSSLVTMLKRDPEFIKVLHGVKDFRSVKPMIVNQYIKESKNRDELLLKLKRFEGKFASEGDLKDVPTDLVSFGSHLYNHYNALTLTEEELTDSYLRNEAELKRYANYVPLFAYPFGTPCFSSKTDKIIKTLGAKKVFSSTPGFNSRHEYNMKRVSMFFWAEKEDDCRYSIIKPTIRSRFKEAFSFEST